MNRSRDWTAIERLPDLPGVAVMTGNGYWLDGKFHPARDGSPKGGDASRLRSRQPVREAATQSLFARFRSTFTHLSPKREG